MAALQLGAQKWGVLTLTGNERFLSLCVSLAVEHGFKLRNPELQERVQQEQKQLREERQASELSERVGKILQAAEVFSPEEWLRYARDQVIRARRQFYDEQYQETLRKAGKQLELLDRLVAKAQKAYDAIKQQEPQRNRVFNFGYERRRKEWARQEFAACWELQQAKREVTNAKADAKSAAEKTAILATEALIATNFQPVVARIAAEEQRLRALQRIHTDRQRSPDRSSHTR